MYKKKFYDKREKESERKLKVQKENKKIKVMKRLEVILDFGIVFRTPKGQNPNRKKHRQQRKKREYWSEKAKRFFLTVCDVQRRKFSRFGVMPNHHN